MEFGALHLKVERTSGTDIRTLKLLQFSSDVPHVGVHFKALGERKLFTGLVFQNSKIFIFLHRVNTGMAAILNF